MAWVRSNRKDQPYRFERSIAKVSRRTVQSPPDYGADAIAWARDILSFHPDPKQA